MVFIAVIEAEKKTGYAKGNNVENINLILEYYPRIVTGK